MFEELSLHMLDLALNSLAAGAKTVRFEVEEDRGRDRLVLHVRDDGRGLDQAALERVLRQNRSSKQSRKKGIGLGLALLRQTCEMCGGAFEMRSTPGQGTTVTAALQWSHVDRPPVGDLEATIMTLCAAHPEVDVQLDYRSDEGTFRFSSRELAAKGTSGERRSPTRRAARPKTRNAPARRPALQSLSIQI